MILIPLQCFFREQAGVRHLHFRDEVPSFHRNTILFHRNLSSEQIASLVPSPSLRKGWAIDCNTVLVCAGQFQENRIDESVIATSPAAAEGRGAKE